MTYDPARAIAHLRSADPVMASLIDLLGPFQLREDGPNPFRALARAIIFQQLSGKAAGTIYGRFLGLFPGLGEAPRVAERRSSPQWDPSREPFPEPAAVLALDDLALRSAGLSRQKVAALRDLAHHFAEGLISHELLHEWDDEAVIEHLTRVRGVGRWTAETFLLFHLRRPDVLPINDVGINRAIMRSYGLESMPGPEQVLEVGKPWRPYASVACWYLWRSEDTVLLSE
jgi:3-methyladenine DNA glycosylase/8-oxoguanine DNA glycosylase